MAKNLRDTRSGKSNGSVSSRDIHPTLVPFSGSGVENSESSITILLIHDPSRGLAETMAYKPRQSFDPRSASSSAPRVIWLKMTLRLAARNDLLMREQFSRLCRSLSGSRSSTILSITSCGNGSGEGDIAGDFSVTEVVIECA